MKIVKKAAVLATALSTLAAYASSASSPTDLTGQDAKDHKARAASAAPAKRAAKSKPSPTPPSPCQRFVGVWTSALSGDVFIRPDNTSYHPDTGVTATLTCSGQSAIFHYNWLWQDRADQWDLSADGNLLTQITGAGFHIQLTRKSAAVPPGESAPTAPETPTPLTIFDFCC